MRRTIQRRAPGSRLQAATRALMLCVGMATGGVSAQTAQTAQPVPLEAYSVHGQFTHLTQQHPPFRAPYAGANSLQASEAAKETTDLTLFLGLRLWRGGALYFDPEIDQGYGLSNTLGVAGFPSGEAYKVGRWRPYYRTQRLFLRQTFALGPATGGVAAGPTALAGAQADARLAVTVGKLSVVDLFDGNRYAHDPRADFMNWAVIDAGAFDYAADAWGYTLGAALEWTRGEWTLRGGWFALSTLPNAETLDTGFGQHAAVVEAERRYALAGRPGAVRLLGYVDRGRIGRYRDALARAVATGAPPDTALVRRRASKSGWAINLEQALADGVGFFARLSANDGRHEAFDFTEIDRSLAAGLAFQGARWHRPDDTVGLALAVNALAADARAYFAAGGLGILIGDGQLPHPGPERIGEAYYAASLAPGVTLSADVQAIGNPAYNRDRGPVRVWGLRLHAEF